MAPANSSRLPALVCTGNAHKAIELGVLLPQLAIEALPAGTPLPAETADDFVGNARIKAVAGRELVADGAWVIADDSGLEVDALDGAPGVWSARFAGEGASDLDNVELLLDRLMDIPLEQRTARFVCVLVAFAPDGTEYVAEGVVDGHIAHVTSGDGGFGYDPIFVPNGHDASFAELGDAVKASMSHRAHAASTLAELIAGHPL